MIEREREREGGRERKGVSEIIRERKIIKKEKGNINRNCIQREKKSFC